MIVYQNNFSTSRQLTSFIVVISILAAIFPLFIRANVFMKSGQDWFLSKEIEGGSHVEFLVKADDLLPVPISREEQILFAIIVSGRQKLDEVDLCVTTNNTPLPRSFHKNRCTWYSLNQGGQEKMVHIYHNDIHWPPGYRARFNIGCYNRSRFSVLVTLTMRIYIQSMSLMN